MATDQQPQSTTSPGAQKMQTPKQSENSLSSAPDVDAADDGRFSVAQEINLDQQSDAARRVGQMPLNAGVVDAMRDSSRPNTADGKDENGLKQSVDRAAPQSP